MMIIIVIVNPKKFILIIIDSYLKHTPYGRATDSDKLLTYPSMGDYLMGP